jgi:hypothetical protein
MGKPPRALRGLGRLGKEELSAGRICTAALRCVAFWQLGRPTTYYNQRKRGREGY